MSALLVLSMVVAPSSGANIIWDGRNADAAELAKWDWARQQGKFAVYIFGDAKGQKFTDYIKSSSAYRNPGIPSSKGGLRFTLDGTSSWHGQDMARTEVIPNTKPLGSPGYQKGVVTTHVSLAMGLEPGVAPLDAAWAHQLVFPESHFFELRYGQQPGWPAPPGGKNLQFFVSGRPEWQGALKPGEWQNFAITVDYDKKIVTLYTSTGGGALQKRAEVPRVSSTSRSDLHIGALRLPMAGGRQLQRPTSIYYSNLWIEAGPPSGL